MHNIK